MLLIRVCLAVAFTLLFVSRSSAQIVISQVYAEGGTFSATYNRDFVELFNRGVTPVNVSGWQVRFKEYNFESWSTATIFGTIQPGRYYLVALRSGFSGDQLPSANATGSIDIRTSGTVALFDSAGFVADHVGYGIAPPFSEGTQFFSTLTGGNSALFRLVNGCLDTDNNSLDFRKSSPPIPFNSTNAPNQCGGAPPPPPPPTPTPPAVTASSSPTSVTSGDAVLLRATVVPGANPASTGLTATVNLSNIGGGASIPLVDDGTNGDETPGDRVFSRNVLVSAATPAGAKSLPVSVADAQGRTATANISLAVTVVVAPTPPTAVVNSGPFPRLSTARMLVVVTPGANPTSTGLRVVMNLTALGGSAATELSNAGGALCDQIGGRSDVHRVPAALVRDSGGTRCPDGRRV